MIYESNPWWKESRVPNELCGRFRTVFSQILSLMPLRQMVILTGLRRTGKSTLMYQLIRALLESGTPETHILYFSFDVQIGSLSELVKQYAIEVVRQSLDDVSVILFFDEIQKVKNWENQIKQLYDRYPKIKIVLSGSAQLTMLKGSRESLAGRFFEVRIHPADFAEYLDFQGHAISIEKEKINENMLKTHFGTYLETGGFIDCFSLPPHLQKQYLREGVLDQVIFRDIPQVWAIHSPQTLSQLMRIFSGHIGLYLEYKSLGNDLNLDQRTLSTYVEYLSMTLLIQQCYNYSPNILTSEKKLKRLYLSNTGFTLALNPSTPFSQLCEQYFINTLQARFFYRSVRQEEVDMVLLNEAQEILPIEVKISSKVEMSDLKSLRIFMKHHHCQKGLVITQDTHKVFMTPEKGAIVAIPYWRYLTLEATLKGFQGNR